MKKCLCVLLATLAALPSAFCQKEGKTIPPEVFYLLPEFGQGTIYFQGKSPVVGLINICAIDGSVRFKDETGQERVVVNDGSLSGATIGDVSFQFRDGNFVRMYPLNRETSLAVERKVDLMDDVKVGAFGMETRTAAITEYGSFSTGDGRIYELNQVKDSSYRMTETATLYTGGKFVNFNKKNCQKAFPDHADEIDAWFKKYRSATQAGVPAVLEACQSWGQ